MNTKKPYQDPTGSFTATVDGVANFNANIFSLVAGRALTISGVQDNKNSPVQTIRIGVDPDIPDGIYEFAVDPQIHSLGVIASGSAFYVTESGTLSVNFDRPGDHYQGTVKINAYDIRTGDSIYVDGVFDLRGITVIPTRKQQ